MTSLSTNKVSHCMAPELLLICQNFYSILRKIPEYFKAPYLSLKAEIHSKPLQPKLAFGSIIKMPPLNKQINEGSKWLNDLSKVTLLGDTHTLKIYENASKNPSLSVFCLHPWSFQIICLIHSEGLYPH